MLWSVGREIAEIGPTMDDGRAGNSTVLLKHVKLKNFQPELLESALPGFAENGSMRFAGLLSMNGRRP